jgi:hypothetical protein
MATRWQRTTLDLLADLGRTKFQARCDAVLSTVRAHPKGILRSALYRAHRDLDQRELDGVLGSLLTQNVIHAGEAQAAGKLGRPPVVYLLGPAPEEQL